MLFGEICNRGDSDALTALVSKWWQVLAFFDGAQNVFEYAFQPFIILVKEYVTDGEPIIKYRPLGKWALAILAIAARARWVSEQVFPIEKYTPYL